MIQYIQDNIRVLLIALLVFLQAYFIIPNKILYDTSGGSCYQGISLLINNFLLIVLVILTFIGIASIFFQKKMAI